MGQYVNLNLENRTAIIILDNPPVNALNSLLMSELDQVFDELRVNPEVRTVIISGAGEKAFVAGADIQQFLEVDPETGYALVRTGQRIFDKIESFECPVIAAINGFALGGGCELAMACDIRIAQENAKLGQPEVNLGIIPGYGGTQRLPRLVGMGKAKELIFAGEPIDAEEAYRIGLVDILVPPGEALNRALALAAKIQEKGPLAVRAAKKAINKGLNQHWDSALETEAALFKALCATEDQKAGAAAFLGKKRAEFKGK